MIQRGEVQTTYTFQQSYYFVMGDNRDDSMDSRIFGLVSENQILGKASRIFCSFKDEQFQLSRLFQQIK